MEAGQRGRRSGGRDNREWGIIGTSQLIGWRTALDRQTRQPANKLDPRTPRNIWVARCFFGLLLEAIANTIGP
jgi:hypothetical protein